MRARRAKLKTLKPVRPNVGIEVAYRRKLTGMVTAMARSVSYWVAAAYRKNKPEIAMDAALGQPSVETVYFGGNSPWGVTIEGLVVRNASGSARRFKTEEAALKAAEQISSDMELSSAKLGEAIEELGAYWRAKFDALGPRLAQTFASQNARRAEASMASALREAGMSVRFQMTPAASDIIQATVRQNVALIRSIPEQYLTNVEGLVMRSVQTGRDLSQLTRDLQEQHGVTYRRAKFIALDQNNKATTAMLHVREMEVGLEKGVWIHSGGGRHPRPKHVAADGTVYDLKRGLPVGDKGQYVLPGQEPNCRCVHRVVVPGLT